MLISSLWAANRDFNSKSVTFVINCRSTGCWMDESPAANLWQQHHGIVCLPPLILQVVPLNRSSTENKINDGSSEVLMWMNSWIEIDLCAMEMWWCEVLKCKGVGYCNLLLHLSEFNGIWWLLVYSVIHPKLN